MAVTPDGIQVETFTASEELWYAISDDPKAAPETIEDVGKVNALEPSLISSSAIQDWREMYLRSLID